MIRILTSIVAVLTISSIGAQHTTHEAPKLVVSITIDQLRGDYLHFFRHNFSEKGFKRFFRESLYFDNITFNTPNPDAVSAIATLHTGATASCSGISSRLKYDAEKGYAVSTFSDSRFLGNYTQDKVSPLSLLCSTVGDELKIASQGKADFYSFSANLEEALAAAGRGANAAFWLDNTTGKWATTTYYNAPLHWIVEQRNQQENTFSQLAPLYSWTPSLPIEMYNSFPYALNAKKFHHKLQSSSSPYSIAKQTPLANQEVVQLASTFIQKAALGKRLYPDMIAISLYAGNSPFNSTTLYAPETQDLYIQLDLQLARLIEIIDENVGLKNTLIILSPTGYFLQEAHTDENPIAIFYPKRCTSLLNMFLMAEYGHQQWVKEYFNGQIFLDRALIKQQNLSLSEIQRKAASFVSEFTGVRQAFALSSLSQESSSKLQNSLYPPTSGDIILELQPGTKIDLENTNYKEPDYRIRNNAVIAPLMFLGANLKAERIKRSVTAEEVAPTVAHILRIRSPNASYHSVIEELLGY